MKHLDLNPEECEVLVPALEREVADLRDEITHTDSGDFKAQLKHRRVILSGILARVGEPAREGGSVA